MVTRRVDRVTGNSVIAVALVRNIIGAFIVFVSHVLTRLTTNFVNKGHSRNRRDGNGPLVCFTITAILRLIFNVLTDVVAV